MGWGMTRYDDLRKMREAVDSVTAKPLTLPSRAQNVTKWIP
jgi:hypothetical protein